MDPSHHGSRGSPRCVRTAICPRADRFRIAEGSRAGPHTGSVLCAMARAVPPVALNPGSGPTHIRIALALAAKAALGAMAGDEHRCIAHGPQPLGDGGDQLLVVALGEIGAANAAGKQHIAHEGPADLRRMEHHMSRCVAGAVAHRERVLAWEIKDEKN